MISTEELLRRFPKTLEVWQGQATPSGPLRASPPESCGPGSLVFASKQDQLNAALAGQASVIVASGKLALPAGLPPQVLVLKTSHVGLAMSEILPFFAPQQKRWSPQGPHPLSFVHPTAQLGEGVTLEPFVFVGEQARIGAGTFVGANSVIEAHAVIGENCRLHPQVFVGSFTQMGDHCEIHPHASIGSEGFGYAQDSSFRHHKLPQLGRVVLGDRVEIGAGSTVDRAAFQETRIGSGTKIDNLCHIAHNCEIGENSLMAGGFMVAGSAKIGKRFMSGGSSLVSDHVAIADDVVLAGRSAVTNDIPQKGAYGGYPTVPMKDHLKTVASLPHLVRLRKQVGRIMKHLNLKEEDSE